MWSNTHPAMHLLAALQQRKLETPSAVPVGEGGNAEENISFQAWKTQIDLFFFLGFNRRVTQRFSLVYITML